MVPHQCGRVEEADKAKDDQRERNAEMVDGAAKRDGLLIHVQQNLRQARADEEKAEQGGRGDEGEKEAVVAPTDTVIEPHTMVILRLDTVVA